MCFFVWIRRKLLSVLQPEGTTPLKWGMITALYFCMFGHALSIQMLFAFLPDMVKSFGIPDEDAGYYVGLLASAVFIGRFFSSYFWGWLSDKIGRRKVLLFTVSSIGVTTLGFGFAKSFAMAFIIRFITGLVAGVVGTVKAALTDICDETNQPLGMAVIITAWNSGLVIGPAIGGYLAKPATKYSGFKKGSLFDNFAYLLPCIVNAVILLLSFLMVFFKFPETLLSVRKRNGKEAVPVPLYDLEEFSQSTTSVTSVNRRFSPKSTESVHNLMTVNYSKQNGDVIIDMQKPVSNRRSTYSTGSVSFLPDVHLNGFGNISGSIPEVNKADTTSYVLPVDKPPGIYARAVGSFRRSKLLTLCRNRDVQCTVALYSVFSFAVIAEHEIYSVWAASGKHLGGLSFDTSDLGFTLMVVGIGTVASNCFVFPQLVRIFGDMKTQFYMLNTAMFFTVVCPATNILYHRSTSLRIAIISILLIIRISQGCCFAGQFIFIGNSVPSNYRATAHGFSMTVMCLARAISPIVSGSIFSWSVTSGLGFPFNEKCVFIFIGFVFWLALVVACCLDPEAVTKRKD